MPRDRQLLDAPTWRTRAAADESTDAGLVKQFTTEVKELDGAERTLEFVISTASVDRDRDTIDPDGWKLDNFLKNPVVLWAHSHWDPPVAKALEISRTQDGLTARAQFPTREELGVGPNEPFFPGTVYNLLRQGYLSATSVGFQPLRWEFNEERGGVDFIEQELLEFSVVPVPANPEALIAASGSGGVEPERLKSWARETLARLEAAEKHVDTAGDNLSRYGYEITLDDEKLAEAVTLRFVDLEGGGYTETDAAGGFYGPGMKEMGDRVRAYRETREEIDKATREAAEPDTKDAIDYDEAHPDGTPKADRDREWNGPDQVAEAEITDLEVMCAWRAEAAEDEEPAKADFKLPHHLADDDHTLVWRGVAAAAARLPQTDIPYADVAAVQEHLGRHYEEFEETAPWDENEESWGAYRAWCEAECSALGEVDREEAIRTLRRYGFEGEARALEQRDDVVELLLSMVEEDTKDEDEQDPIDWLLEADEAELRAAIEDDLDEVLGKHVTAVTGRLD